ncbi:hypothetical protein PDIG_08570 [Penicillium digitatum PHI26]|uniref:Uncharacterized protein n=2 Tax=Penicillium digitatum TaxID=36651 RepID=K9GV92_PEND2|nr:hypothetical protein PDIP_36590 [Penicillium digitatum Pd1]EKV16326.1 hypothetical protein PDIP_36590 [Penicillium digitatum Pd1]EKV18543.1 hypothetical protein PDIG_08570 [Penicillium digitatum PHI26]
MSSLFISSTVSVFHESTIRLAATHPTLFTGNPKDDVYCISILYAFDDWFKGLIRQTWNPRSLSRYTDHCNQGKGTVPHLDDTLSSIFY